MSDYMVYTNAYTSYLSEEEKKRFDNDATTEIDNQIKKGSNSNSSSNSSNSSNSSSLNPVEKYSESYSKYLAELERRRFEHD